MPTFLGDSAERAAESAADRVVAWIGENDPPLPDNTLTMQPDDPSRMVPRTPCDARIVDGDLDADGNPAVEAHSSVWASWTRAVRDGLVSAFDLVRANLLGHRLFYLGCLKGDVPDLAALKERFGYHLAAYDSRALGAKALETLLIVGDGSRRWFFCGLPFESDEGPGAWLCRVWRALAIMNADWVMTYESGEMAGGDWEWNDGVAAQVVVPPLLAYHATMRKASGKSRSERRARGFGIVPEALRSFVCLWALEGAAATWMGSPEDDIPTLGAVAAHERRRLRKFDMHGREGGWFDRVVIGARTWQDAAPSIRGKAALLP